MAARYTREIATELINKFGARPEMLVQILHLFMDRFGSIGDDAIRQLAGELNLSRAEVHGVVSFYHDFRTVPAGRCVIKICQAESCQAMGSQALTAHASASLGVSLHETTEDGRDEPRTGLLPRQLCVFARRDGRRSRLRQSRCESTGCPHRGRASE